MPLNSPEDYVRMGRHLEEIDASYQQFLRESGYRDFTGQLGRYPHRSAMREGREGQVWRKIDLMMDEDAQGNRFDTFFPEIPYTLWCGAWLDEGTTRYYDGGFVLFQRLPFSQVKEVLAGALAQAAARLEGVSASTLKQSGQRITLSAR